VITPGDREDLLSAVVGYKINRAKAGIKIAGVVLTGGIKPHKTAIDMLKKVDIPVLFSKDDTYSVASCIHDLKVKVQPEDFEKTKIIKRMVEKYVDVDLLSHYL
jgi:phosphate acetyltransferase